MTIKNRFSFWLLIVFMPVGLGLFGFSVIGILDWLFDNGKHPFDPDADVHKSRAFLVSIVLGVAFYLLGCFGVWKLGRELFAERSLAPDPDPVDPSAIKISK